jgi:quinol monooxygenase YgiN
VIIVAGHFVMRPGEREQFIRSYADVMRQARSEPGCLAHALSADPLDAGQVLLFERWETKAALADHLDALRHPEHGVEVSDSEVQQYEISAVGPVGS